MNKLELTDEQLKVVFHALDFYSRVGTGQFREIKDHPTFEKSVEEKCRSTKTPEVGDRTPQGEILEIKKGKALINGSVKNKRWCKDTEWKLLKDVVLSVDYTSYHAIRDEVDQILTQARNILYNDNTFSSHGGWGIYNPKVDESCRVGFDILQVIRHEWWKDNPNRSSITVDSSTHLTTEGADKIKCKIKER